MTRTESVLSLEDRIARIEAVEAIKALKYRYWRACDAKDAAGFRASFIKHGAVIDFGQVGAFPDADGIAAVFTAVALEKIDGEYNVLDMHHGLHPDIRLTGEGTAEGEWTLRFRQVNLRAGTEKVSAIEYADEYAVEDGQWKVSKCVAKVLWAMHRPLAEGTAISQPFG